MELVKTINKYLVDHYGVTLDGRPRFRVVWSDTLFEKRKGKFERRTEGGLYLGTFEGIMEVPKYNYIRERWILEVLTHAFPEAFDPSIKHLNQEVMVGDGYEPLKVFQNKERRYLPPDMEICKLICDKFVDLINRPRAARLTEKQDLANEKADVEHETETFFDMLNQDDPFMAGQFRDGEAVIIHREDN